MESLWRQLELLTDAQMQVDRCRQVLEAATEAARREFRDGTLRRIDIRRDKIRKLFGVQESVAEFALAFADLYGARGSPRWESQYTRALRAKRSPHVQNEIQIDLKRFRHESEKLAMERDALVQTQEASFIAERILKEKQGLDAAIRSLHAAQRTYKSVLMHHLSLDFLCAGEHECAIEDNHNVINYLRDARCEFIQRWVTEVIGNEVNKDQAIAIGSVHDHAIVAARAGSGKTRTLILRTAFLIKHCGVSPDQVLLLAFNRKAAEEMRLRLEHYDVFCPHVMTFHALGYAITRPEEAIVYDEPSEQGKQQSALMQRVINTFLRDPNRERKVREVMMAHFKVDWDKIIGDGIALSRAEGLLLRRSLEREALDGTRVKSFGEKAIANFLFEHGIRYAYEQNHWWGQRNYRPDFTLYDHKVVIEYFGRTGDSDYDEQIKEKQEYWANRANWTLLEYQPSQLGQRGRQGLDAALASDLNNLGIQVVRLSEDEIWHRVQSRVMTRFAEVLKQFIARCRKAQLTPDDLENRLVGHDCLNDIERDVLSIASDAYRTYLDQLNSERKEDFDGLLERAAQCVRDGVTTFERKSGAGDLSKVRFVMVDEYQDFSPLFNNMLSAIRSLSTNEPQMFGVGDNWQAINGFAGSDPQFFHDFESYFEPSVRLNITTNYRSSRKVIEVGNRIMSGREEHARPRDDAPQGSVLLADLSQLYPSPAERHHWQGDTITPAVRRLIQEPLKSGKSIALIARQMYLPFHVFRPENGRFPKEDLVRLRMLICKDLTDSEKEQVHVGTTHAYKGGEADFVIVLDAVERRFPKIHPAWVFGRIFGDTPASLIDEEQRLFYVACSRAKATLVLITERGRESPFMNPISAMCSRVNWTNYRPYCPIDGDWMILVGNASGSGSKPTADRVDTFKARGYEYEGADWPHWRTRIDGIYGLDWIIVNLPNAQWLPGPDGLEIRICSSDGEIAAKFVLRDGQLINVSSSDESL